MMCASREVLLCYTAPAYVLRTAPHNLTAEEPAGLEILDPDLGNPGFWEVIVALPRIDVHEVWH